MQKLSEYVPPKVWKWEKENNINRFSNINRPISGATSDKDLPKGVHPIQLYSLGTPNGQKVTIMLEELLEAGHADAEYDAWLINIMERDQFSTGFVGINPNSKIPAMVDYSNENDPQRVFESGSILFYLAKKFECFFPKERKARTEAMSWLMWQMGSGPILGGGFGHFYAYAPFKIEYAVDRFSMEVKRQLDVLDKQLENNEFIIGNELTIADFAIYPWYGAMARGLLYKAGDFLEVETYTHLSRWAKQLSKRPAFKKGSIVNRSWGSEKGIKERHSASDFKGKV
jgi:GST-like protein